MPEGDLYDLLIVGGGINGAGIARDAAGRGWRVLLCEKGDLGGATSSASSKLIHGGLRYLEYFEFRLVREALREREVLMGIAPHLVRPLRFLLPRDKGLRAAWKIRAGLFLYDRLAGASSLPGSGSADLTGGPLKPEFEKGFAYSDCRADDARLVVINANDAAARGADIRPRTRCGAARRVFDGSGAETERVWEVELDGDHPGTVRARVLINAAGPWVDRVGSSVIADGHKPHLKLVQGSHILVDRLYEDDHAYLLQNDDGRIVFAIPYERRFTLIGTTETHLTEPEAVAINDAETDYLLAAANRYFKRRMVREDVRWTYSGVRPLFDDGHANASAVTRDYVFDLDAPSRGAPLLTIYGGKLTTYRRLAEHALRKLARLLDRPDEPWSANVALPGGDLGGDYETFVEAFALEHPFLPAALAERYSRLYGSRAVGLVADATELSGLGQCLAPDLGGGLYAAELDMLCREEWVQTVDDVLWRRTKLGLELLDSPDEARAVAAGIDEYLMAK